MNHVQPARILIVDDQVINIRVLQRILERAGYTALQTTTEPTRVSALCAEFRPDIILLDLMMPELDGFEVMRQLRTWLDQDVFLPILVLTADTTPETKLRALEQGAKDFLTKPFDHTEVVLRIKNLLETRRLYQQVQAQNELLASQNQTLEQKVRERTARLSLAQREVVTRLAQANEFRDDITGEHIYRVSKLSALLARALGRTEREVEVLQQAATLHDVGKIAITDNILLKPGLLDDDERHSMESHTTRGAELLKEGHSEVMRMAERIAHSHHERWDGRGYPNGLQGDEIPLEGRIVAVIDVFDALTHERPYKLAWPIQQALQEIQRQSGAHFDPQIVQAFLALPLDSLV